MTLAESWYENAAFWSGAGVAVAIAAIVVGAWATLRAAYPRRRLTYYLRSIAPLIPPTASRHGRVAVEIGSVALTDPHVLHVELANPGSHDIPSSAFDGGDPIELDLGANVVTLLATTSTPPHAAAPSVNTDERILTVGPSLIAKGQLVTISVLVDGPAPELTVRTRLTDVSVREGGGAVISAARVDPMISMAFGLVTAGLSFMPLLEHEQALLVFGIGTGLTAGGAWTVMWAT
ncbi:hypothetical protein [Streptomyces melanogenes]|uniref:hypothetical protein n=1 Tax=Streptomyces melanogenes TaxID=67326 RepID=UPI00167E025F|nr:hypothetical protein [Streptomyces melanogenes]GGP78529.1 hypothetical protein GCM10010278_66240 [Streptomyces melanogenes]